LSRDREGAWIGWLLEAIDQAISDVTAFLDALFEAG
jgi:hypothetical protein